MSTIVVKNFPDDLHGRLKARAVHNRRSMTQEAVHLIAAGLGVEPASVVQPRQSVAPIADGREALRAALIKQRDGSYVNVLGIEDEAFFATLERIRNETQAPDVTHLFDNAA